MSAELKAAVDYLAARCDYAREDDDAGFNGSDTGFGHELAAKPLEAWSQGDRIAARVMLQKYRGQLEAIGVDPRELPRETSIQEAPAGAREALEQSIASEHRKAATASRAAVKRETAAVERAAEKSSIRLQGSEFLVAFPYRKETVDACRAIPGRKTFDRGLPGWRLRVDDVEPQRLLDFLERFKIEIPEPVRAKLVELIRHPRPKLGTTAVALRAVALAADGLTFELAFPYDSAILDALRRDVPAARWNKARQVWQVPVRAASTEGLGRFLADHPAFGFKVQAEAQAAIGRVLDGQREALESSRAAEADAEFTALIRGAVPAGLAPFPFQAAGVRYALNAKRLIIGDEMGLGKTIQAILTVVLGDAWPVVVVCPASLVYNWYREFRKWAPGRTISILQAGRLGAYRADVLIVNYELLTERAAAGVKRPKRKNGDPVPLSRHARGILEAAPRAVVFDEVHYLKNYKALRTLAAREIARHAEFRIGLSGTAIVNAPGELIAPLTIIGRLEDLGGFRFYVNRFCAGDAQRGASNLIELNTKLRQSCYIRREKSQVLTDLPEKQWTRVELDITNRDEYDRAAKDVAAFVGDQARENRAFLERLERDLDAYRMTLLADGIAADKLAANIAIERERRIAARAADAKRAAKRAEALARIEVLKQIAVRGKLEAVKEWIAEFTAQQKLIAFAAHVPVQKAIASVHAGAVHIFGEDSKEDREAAVQRFQTEPRERCPLLVSSIKAGGVGWTGTAASNVAFVEPGWTPGEMDQAIDRAHRIGQRDSVTGYELVARDTIEGEIYDLIAQKRAVVEAALIGGQVLERVDVLDSLLARLGAVTVDRDDARVTTLLDAAEA